MDLLKSDSERNFPKVFALLFINTLLSMNKYCWGTVLLARFGDVEAAAGKSNSLRKLSDLNLSPVLLIVAYRVLLWLVIISPSGGPPIRWSNSLVT